MSLSCSPPDTALSVNLRWLLCVPVWGFFFSSLLLWLCKPPHPPAHCRRFLWMCSVVVPRSDGGAPEKRKRSFVGPLVEERRADAHKMRPHRGDSMVGCCVPPTQAAFSCTAPARRTFIYRHNMSLQVSPALFVAVSIPAVPRTSCRHGALWQPLIRRN